MTITNKIYSRIHQFYRQKIVCEQYPMLTALNRKEWQQKHAIGVVYMLHHITEKNPKGIPTNEDLKVSPYFLEHIITEYANKGFDFISLDQLYQILYLGIKPQKPFIAFTIDDGYLDNYVQALPIFEKHNVPFAIFVASDFIDKRAILWWDCIEELILNNKYIVTNDNKTYPCRTFQEQWNTFRYLRESILKCDPCHLEHELNTLFNNYDIDWYAPIKSQGMSWDQIKVLSNHPLCTIGGHTKSHPALNRLNDNDFHNDILVGIETIEKNTGNKVIHFAYPYGSKNEIGEREERLILNFNFKTVFFACGGCITKSNMHNINHIPRVFLHE